MFSQAKHIFQAKVPVVKLEATAQFGFKKVDITMMDQNHNGLKCADTLLEFQAKYPVLRPLFLVLKEILFLAHLNDPSQVKCWELTQGRAEQLRASLAGGGLSAKQGDDGGPPAELVSDARDPLRRLLQLLQLPRTPQN